MSDHPYPGAVQVDELLDEVPSGDSEEIDDEWLRTTPKPKPKLFAYDWARGYVSPFRSTPLESFRNFCDALISLQLLNGEWETQVLYDLGCGDGIVNVEVAKRFGTRGVGIDLDETLISKANALAEAQNVSNLVSFKVQDLLKSDLSEATILFMYLLPEALEKLKPILEQQISRNGVLLIVEQWPLLNWEHHLVYTHDQGKFRVYSSEPSQKKPSSS